MKIIEKSFNNDILKLKTDIGSFTCNNHGIFRDDGQDMTWDDIGGIQDFCGNYYSGTILTDKEFYFLDDTRYVAIDNMMSGNTSWEKFKTN
jgi:hypothetical protein